MYNSCSNLNSNRLLLSHGVASERVPSIRSRTPISYGTYATELESVQRDTDVKATNWSVDRNLRSREIQLERDLFIFIFGLSIQAEIYNPNRNFKLESY